MTARMLPSIVKSRLALGLDAAPEAPAFPVVAAGTTYTMAQEATWLDADHYAVGRWDGSLSVFAFTQAVDQGPIIARAVNCPAQEGVQMITPLTDRAFACSNDDESLVVWQSASGAWTDLELGACLRYDSGYGAANSGVAVMLDGMLHLVVGHAGGFVTIWAADGIARWHLLAATDVRSPTPVNPWQLHNVRGLALAGQTDGAAFVVGGSEDGNLTVVSVPDGKIVSAAVYNPAAQRGINSLAVDGTVLLVANCAVGPDDHNLWSYEINPGDWTLTCRDRVNLVVAPGTPQVFNFDVVIAAERHDFYCSTEEGALWAGTICNDGRLQVAGHRLVTTALGAALCYRDRRLALTAYNLHEFVVAP